MGLIRQCLQKRWPHFVFLPWAGYPETASRGTSFSFFSRQKLSPAQAGDCDVPFKPNTHKTHSKTSKTDAPALTPWGACRNKTGLQEAPGLLQKHRMSAHITHTNPRLGLKTELGSKPQHWLQVKLLGRGDPTWIMCSSLL